MTPLLISESVKYFATACGSTCSSSYKERNSARVGERSRITNSTVPQSMWSWVFGGTQSDVNDAGGQ